MDFYYDSVNMREPKMGSVVAGVFTPSDTTDYMGVTIDDNVQVTTNFTGSTPKGIRFTADVSSGVFVEDITDYVENITDYVEDLGTAGIGTATHLIINRISGTPNVEVWASNERSANYVKVFDSAIEDNDWSINQLDSSTSKSYFVVQFTGTYNIDVGEIILAQKITGLYRYDNGWTHQLVPAVKLKSSYDGLEVSNRENDLKEDRNLPYKVLNATYKGKLESLNSGIYAKAKSFLVVEGSERRFGKLKERITFKEIGYNHYSANLPIRSFV